MADGYDLANLSINEIPTRTVVAGTDFMPFYDVSAGSWGKVLVSTEFASVSELVPAGSTLSATVAEHANKTILLDTAAGSVVTLPAATGSGAVFHFIVSTTATSNSHIIKVADATDLFYGFIDILDVDGTTISGYKANGTDSDTITMNRTTTGGLIGDMIVVQDIGTNAYVIRDGKLTCVAGSNPVTPFSATV